MAKRKIKQHEPLPIRQSSHIKEDDSNDIFRGVVKPWMFKGAVTREYGIDGTVEITKPLSTLTDQIVTGKRFSVQLKSSVSSDFNKAKFSLSVARDKINYWFGSIEPVLLVFVDLTSKSCFFRWVDENLIQELFLSNRNWIAQTTVSIKFDKEKIITPKSLLEIERYVLNWKRQSRTILTPGNYFKFSREAKSFIDLFAAQVKEYGINFLAKEIKELKESTAYPIYTVAIVGPNKAGKSTLINSLLQKEVSPVGMLPTTGIPITIFPSNENKSVVLFKDNKELEGSIEESFLREYTSKDKNPNNQKKVKIVSVQIINSLLERGFALCDVPGLDDPDSEIRQITKTALYNVNAIIYVISAGSFASRDFSITKQIIEDLHELGGRMDRLFLVFNKVDILNVDHMEELKQYVDSTLENFDVLKYLPSEPIYISSKKSFENRIQNQNTDDSVGLLEKHMWEYLLSQNKTGLHKIMGSFGDCLEISDKLKKIINTSMIDAEKSEGLENEIKQVSIEINELRKLVADNRLSIYASLQQYLENSFAYILDYLKQDLDSVASNIPLPLNKQITQWLEDNAFKTISELYSNLQQDIYELQSTINQWISEKLKQVEIGIESPDSSITFKMPEINRYTNQINSYYYEKKSGYLGLLESFFEGIGNFLENIFVAIADIFTTDIKKRDRQKRDIISKSRRCYKNISEECLFNLNQYLNNICRFMEEKSIDRAKVYLGELSSQLKKLDQPISKADKKNFEKFLDEVEKIENGIQSNLTHLKAYTDGVEWIK
jgi:ribosome biogenesis GTPase A